MTPTRAKEIIKTRGEGNRFGEGHFDYGYKMTEAEVQEVKKVWDTMPGYTCFANALGRIGKGE